MCPLVSHMARRQSRLFSVKVPPTSNHNHEATNHPKTVPNFARVYMCNHSSCTKNHVVPMVIFGRGVTFTIASEGKAVGPSFRSVQRWQNLSKIVNHQTLPMILHLKTSGWTEQQSTPSRADDSNLWCCHGNFLPPPLDWIPYRIPGRSASGRL
jgi:hypothetical protein